MKHVIIGAGPAGVIAAETLRGADGQASVTVIGYEPEPPYSRMAIRSWDSLVGAALPLPL